VGTIIGVIVVGLATVGVSRYWAETHLCVILHAEWQYDGNVFRDTAGREASRRWRNRPVTVFDEWVAQ
jgi:hypothetical protein